MAITISIVGESTKVLDEKDIITISQQVQILDTGTVIGDKIITISVPKNTDLLKSFAVQQMKSECLEFKRLATGNRNINTSFSNFSTLLATAVA